MAFFNTALLVSLSIVLSSVAAKAPPTLKPSFRHVSPNALKRSSPMDVQAKDRQYLRAHMIAAANKVEQFSENVVAKRLRDPTTTSDDSTKQCLQVCEEVYGNAAEAMRKAAESVVAGDFFKANMDVSAFGTNIDTCDECFGDFHDFDDWARGVSGDCLGKIVKYTN